MAVQGKLPAQGSLPDVTFESLRGGPVMFLVEGRESMEKQQAKGLKLALDRWIYPDDLQAFVIADGRPFRFIPGVKKMAGEFMEAMRPELRLPMYADFSGDALDPLGVASGDFELVLLAPDGTVRHRHRGDATPEQTEELRALLGAHEPPPPPPAPDFEVEGLRPSSCAERGCMLVFLGAPVSRADLPGLEDGGFEGSREEAFAQLAKPHVRLMTQVATRWDLEKTPVDGVLIGEGPADLLEGWRQTPAAPAVREALGLASDSTALVMIGKDGSIAFSAETEFPFWRMAQAREALGLEDRPWGS